VELRRLKKSSPSLASHLEENLSPPPKTKAVPPVVLETVEVADKKMNPMWCIEYSKNKD